MNRKICLTVAMAAGLLLANVAIAEEGHNHKHDHEHGEEAEMGVQTIEGEVLDMSCYMAHEGKGAKHKKCALACIKGGLPMGILTKDGAVYLVVEDHSKKKAYKQLKKWAAEQVTVKGEIIERGGVQAIIVQSASKVK